MVFSNKLGNKVVSSNKLGNEVVSSNEVSNRVGNKVGDKVGNKVSNGVSNGVGNKGNCKKVDGEDKPAKVSEEISINKEMTNPLKTKPKPPKAKFRVKDAIRAKFGPNIEYTASIAIEAENGSVKEIVIAKKKNSN